MRDGCAIRTVYVLLTGLRAHASKACDVKASVGSNPTSSAKTGSEQVSDLRSRYLEVWPSSPLLGMRQTFPLATWSVAATFAAMMLSPNVSFAARRWPGGTGRHGRSELLPSDVFGYMTRTILRHSD